MAKILICENEEILLTALEFRLRKRGYEVEVVADGDQAMARFRSEVPDLFLTDLEAPGLPGVELIRGIRGELGVTAPIVFIAPLEMGAVIVEALTVGADDFVTKPFKPVELVLRIQHLLGDTQP